MLKVRAKARNPARGPGRTIVWMPKPAKRMNGTKLESTYRSTRRGIATSDAENSAITGAHIQNSKNRTDTDRHLLFFSTPIVAASAMTGKAKERRVGKSVDLGGRRIIKKK